MKKIILTLLIVGLALAHGSFNIELGSRFSVGNRIGYELVCDYGSAVTYHIDGLPEGATL